MGKDEKDVNEAESEDPLVCNGGGPAGPARVMAAGRSGQSSTMLVGRVGPRRTSRA